jgi:DNA-binding transcriptional MerR regulator
MHFDKTLIATDQQERLFSSTEVCRLSGISYRQLDYWDRRLFVSPSVGASGSGSRRRWSRDSIVLANVMASMAAISCRLDQTGPVLEHLKVLRRRGIPWPSVLTLGPSGIIESDRVPAVISIDLYKIEALVDHQIAQLP